MNLDIENTRRKLIAFREKYGADSPAGHRCSNIIEQLQNMQHTAGDQREHLVASINKQIAELPDRADQPQ